MLISSIYYATNNELAWAGDIDAEALIPKHTFHVGNSILRQWVCVCSELGSL